MRAPLQPVERDVFLFLHLQESIVECAGEAEGFFIFAKHHANEGDAACARIDPFDNAFTKRLVNDHSAGADMAQINLGLFRRSCFIACVTF